MKKLYYLTGAFLLVFMLVLAPLALSPDAGASEDDASTSGQATVALSKDQDAAAIGDIPFAADSFSRAQVGSNREKDGSYLGYCFYVGSEPGKVSLVSVDGRIYVHIDPQAAEKAGYDLQNPDHQQALMQLLVALDNVNDKGGTPLSADADWVFITKTSYTGNGITLKFDQPLKSGQYYTVITGDDGADISDKTSDRYLNIAFADACVLSPASEVEVTPANQGLEALAEFLSNIDMSPLWITLKTSLTAIVIVFFLGLLAAYFCLRLSPRAQDIADSIFTIPMVLPPTVCGFLLLLAFSRNTPIGQWFIDIGFPLVFSWQATVLAAVVVAFPRMYRSARGAFENLDSNMLDAARTLGWSEAKIFFKLMLPLSWSSIAAGTVLAFARGLGEFGATLFLAGNYLGITRTVPIAIYFEWTNGNIEVAIFWTIVIIIFSFIVILFINLWSRRTTKYRRREGA